MYAYFADYGCDPLAEGVVTNGNQVCISLTILYSRRCYFPCKKLSLNIQMTIVISNSRISNNRLSRSENLIPA